MKRRKSCEPPEAAVYSEWSSKASSIAPGRIPTDPLWYMTLQVVSLVTTRSLTISSAICIDTIRSDDSICGLACLHVFHHDCLRQATLSGIVNCPICKAPVYPQKQSSGRNSKG